MFPDPSLHSTYSARLFLRRPCTAKAARITTERCKKPVAAKSGIEAGTSSCRATDCHRSVRSYHLPASAQPLGFFLIWPSLLGNPGFLLRRGLSSRRPSLIQRILQPFLGPGRFATHPWSDSKEKGSENMAAATSASTMSLLPISQLKQQHRAAGALVAIRRPRDPRRRRYVVTTARLFGPAIFEASKLKVLFLGKDEAAPPENKPPPPPLPRTYTLTHSDVTASLTLAVSHTVNRAQLQGWYNRLQRDEVVAEWKKVRGRMSLHVHCHISGGHFLLDLIAGLRYYIFRKELPVVLQAFVHGDVDLFSRHPELEEATVWVYFHSNLPRFNRVECWGPLRDAAAPAEDAEEGQQNDRLAACEWPRRCPQQCECCFPPHSLIPWPNEHDMADAPATGQTQQ